jgi:phthalate 4,5-cis-dihydrodiol dehydrogenase
MAANIRMGIVGLGRAAAATLPSLKAHPGLSLVAAADPNPDARARFERDLGGATYPDAETLCNAGGVDALYIATPHQCHVGDALTAARHGKHMIIEKPMALSLEECRRIVEAAREAGVVALVGHTHGFDPAVRKMRELIASGEVGQPRMITSLAYSDFLYRPRRPEELDSSLGGGIMYNQVPHQIEMARVVAAAPLRSVRACAGNWDPRRPTEGAMSAFLDFENGAVASLVYSGYDRFDVNELHGWITPGGAPKRPSHGAARRALAASAGGDEAGLKSESGFAGRGMPRRPEGEVHQPHFGVLLVSCERADLKTAPDGLMVYDDAGVREIRLPAGRGFPNRDAVADDFFDAVTGQRKLLQDAAWGAATVAAMLALVRSSRERREVLVESPAW